MDVSQLTCGASKLENILGQSCNYTRAGPRWASLCFQQKQAGPRRRGPGGAPRCWGRAEGDQDQQDTKGFPPKAVHISSRDPTQELRAALEPVALTQPGKVESDFLPKVLADVVQRLVLAPLPPVGPVLEKDLARAGAARGWLLWWGLAGALRGQGKWARAKPGLWVHQGAPGLGPCLASCSGKAAVKTPSLSSRSTPTSRSLEQPYCVVARIS